MKILIKNARVYDPINKINGDEMDILIEDGVFVDKFTNSNGIYEIDCKGRILMQTGIDIHSHIAGGTVNVGRLMRPEDKTIVWNRNGDIRSGSGFSVPSTFLTGYEYALLGYSFVNQPITPPLTAKHTHEELQDIPLIDKTSLLLLGNNFNVASFISNGEREKLMDYVSWMLNATKTYGIKAVNPGGFLSWLWKMERISVHERIPKFDIKPSDIIKALEEVSNNLSLPHPFHVHLNYLGYPGNYEVTLESLKIPKKRMHVAHIQFNSYDGNDWNSFSSSADKVMKEINKNKKISIDIGQVTLDNTTTMTADSPFEQYLYKLTGMKWSSRDIELECGAGIVPYIYSKSRSVNSIQWAIGLEIALLSKDLDRLCLTTDHPNAGPFIRYPRIIAWLMSKKFRDETARNIKLPEKKTILFSIDREFSIYEISQITRKSSADILGLKSTGIRSEGRADIAIYDIREEELKNPERIERAFSNAEYTIIRGEIVVKEKKVVSSKKGVTFYSKREIIDESIEKEIETFFRKRYSVGISNYIVEYPNIMEVK